MPTTIYHLAVWFVSAGSIVPGTFELFTPVFPLLAARARKTDIEQELNRT